jgi:hypothetical protein
LLFRPNTFWSSATITLHRLESAASIASSLLSIQRAPADDRITPNRLNRLSITLVAAEFNVSSSIAIPRSNFES